MEREALKAVIKKYVLYDRFFRRAYLVAVAQMSGILLVFTALFIVKKPPAVYLLLISTGVWLGVGLGAPLIVAGAIQREKAEGSFRTLRALPLSAETLFLGTILGGVTASILALVPPYMSDTIVLEVEELEKHYRNFSFLSLAEKEKAPPVSLGASPTRRNRVYRPEVSPLSPRRWEKSKPTTGEGKTLPILDEHGAFIPRF